MHGAAAGVLGADAGRLRVADERVWKLGEPHPHTIIEGIELLFHNGFWPFGVVLIVVSVAVPFAKLIVLSWFCVSIHRRSVLAAAPEDPAVSLHRRDRPLVQSRPVHGHDLRPDGAVHQIAHIDIMGGSPAFLATVVLSMIATRVLRPAPDVGRGGGGCERGRVTPQTWKLSPQPQRPFSFGLLKVKPASAPWSRSPSRCRSGTGWPCGRPGRSGPCR